LPTDECLGLLSRSWLDFETPAHPTWQHRFSKFKWTRLNVFKAFSEAFKTPLQLADPGSLAAKARSDGLALQLPLNGTSLPMTRLQLPGLQPLSSFLSLQAERVPGTPARPSPFFCHSMVPSKEPSEHTGKVMPISSCTHSWAKRKPGGQLGGWVGLMCFKRVISWQPCCEDQRWMRGWGWLSCYKGSEVWRKR
jgi:hypothetical protein